MKLESRIKHSILTITAAMLIVLFTYTAVSKLVDLDVFRAQLRTHPLPSWAISGAAIIIPISEILASILLLFKATRLQGLYCCAVLLAIFTIYIGLILLDVFGRMPCACGGVLQQMGFGSHFLFNLFFLTITLIGIYIIHQLKGGLLSRF
jgi:putative oxidoreductase